MPPPPGSAGAEVYAEQDMRLATRGKIAPPEHVATRDAGSLVSAQDVAFW